MPDHGDIRRWVLGALAVGPRGIWNHRTEPFWGEAHGFGLLQMTGNSTERAEEAGRIGRAIADNADLFARGEHPRSAVAMILDERLWHLLCSRWWHTDRRSVRRPLR